MGGSAKNKGTANQIMNLSSPKGNSLNDVIDMDTVQKIGISSPKLFAEELVKGLRNADPASDPCAKMAT